MAPHSSILAWKIPWMEEPGGLQSMGSWRVRHNWVTLLSLFTFMHWRRNGNPLQCSCLENPRDGRAWLAAIYGVAQSWTRLKWHSSSSSSGSRNYSGKVFVFFFHLKVHHCSVQKPTIFNYKPYILFQINKKINMRHLGTLACRKKKNLLNFTI